MLSVAALVLVSLANVLLAISVLLNNPRASLNRAYASLAIVLPVWSVIVYLENTSVGLRNIHALAMLDYSLATLLIAIFFWFCKEFAKFRNQAVTVIVAVGAIVNLGLIWSGQTLHVVIEQNNVVFASNWGFYVFLAYMVALVIFGMWLLGRTYLHSRGKTRVQLKFIGLGFVLSIASLIIAEVIIPRFFAVSSTEVTRVGIYSTVLFTALCWFAIVRHRFMDIRLLVAHSVAYVLLLATLAGIYGAAIFATSLLFFEGSTNTLAQGITYTVMSVVLAFTFQPLRRFFDRVTGKVLYRDRYDSQEVLNNFSKILVSELDLGRILKKALTELCDNLHIQFGQLIIFNNGRVYRVEHVGPLPKRLMVAPELAKLNRSMLVADEIEHGERKELMDTHGIRVSMELSSREEFVGYLLLGDKLSGDIFTTQDIALLEIVRKELAVALQNAKAYAEIQDFNVTLQARVDHATGRLRVANRHLKELDRAKDEFISMASHQLRTPLTTIKGYLSMMLEGDAGKMSSAQKEFVGYAFSSSERMVNLISDLLNVSRLSAGRFLIQTKPTDMVQMVADEVRQLETHAAAKGLKLIFDRPPNPLPPAQIDDNKTRQVIMNFIDNAIYYTQSGEVRVKLKQTQDMVRLEVIDTGIGVPDDAKRKLFSKFYRADNAQIVRPDGTGLGLYLAKRVVEDQGGTIIFSSTVGKGSTFGFQLPTRPLPSPHKEKHGRK